MQKEVDKTDVLPYSSDELLEEEVTVPEEPLVTEKFVVSVRRVAKVLKGGKKLSFSVAVVVGNKNGYVGYALGKANEVPAAIEKATKKATKSLIKVPIENTTIPHAVIGQHGATKVLLKPARPGTGVIAGLTVRAVMDSAGILDVLTKIIGSTNPINVLHATFDALKKLKSREEIYSLRKG